MDLNYLIRERFGGILKKARNDANISQDTLARRMGVSKKTIQNWEDGLNCPKLDTTFVIFTELGLQPHPYFLQALYEEEFKEISSKMTDKEVENALIQYIKNVTPQCQRKLLYMLYGNHGSSPQCVLEMITAHLHTPLRDRINIAQSIMTNYIIAESMGDLVKENHILPNLSLLEASIIQSQKAVISGNDQYNVFFEE